MRLIEQMRDMVSRQPIVEYSHRGYPGSFTGRLIKVGDDYAQFELFRSNTLEVVGKPCIPISEINWFDPEPQLAFKLLLEQCYDRQIVNDPNQEDDGGPNSPAKIK